MRKYVPAADTAAATTHIYHHSSCRRHRCRRLCFPSFRLDALLRAFVAFTSTITTITTSSSSPHAPPSSLTKKTRTTNNEQTTTTARDERTLTACLPDQRTDGRQTVNHHHTHIYTHIYIYMFNAMRCDAMRCEAGKTKRMKRNETTVEVRVLPPPPPPLPLLLRLLRLLRLLCLFQSHFIYFVVDLFIAGILFFSRLTVC
ncbi:uncharacterized protein IWZ02DRAFT_147872 [Phyllosticta citriasiana]|uniref:Uncharacterized protein n=1 Tax=Phyllosticta citriasiana TaxID=595635 RepID=A0ABR1KDC4_9PEZI